MLKITSESIQWQKISFSISNRPKEVSNSAMKFDAHLYYDKNYFNKSKANLNSPNRNLYIV